LKDFVVPELGIGTILKPFQKPHPPMAVSAVSPFSYSVKHAGRRGWGFISAHFCIKESIRSHWEAYRQGCEEAKRTPDPEAWRVARVIHVDRDAGAARAFVDNPDGPVRFFWSYLLGVLGRAKMLPLLKTDPAMPDSAITVDYAIREFTLLGDPRSVADQIMGLREEVGDFRMIVQLALELVRRTEIEASMRLLAEEVMPLVKA
jgi:alkanesulfonate monooxygenase SsuD/methylene tetrahydromethanopterin reductase-like flavin-dependent oxidoreductase (luciferase family)